MAQNREEFDPAKYSEEENAFFVKHMGESPLAALQSPLPEGVNPVTVEKVLGRTYELEQLKEHKGVTWIGLQRIANACTIFLNERARWRKLAERGSPTFPTMHAWDGKGRPHRGGIGSDSGHVRTYFTEDGDRKRFAVSLFDIDEGEFKPPWVKTEEDLPNACIEDVEKGVLQCPLDGWTTNWRPESRQSYNLARARMIKHCKTSKDDRVREFGLKVFG